MPRSTVRRSRPARREMRSARWAARRGTPVVRSVGCGGAVPVWPSLMAMVERAEREVVVELGVELGEGSVGFSLCSRWVMVEHTGRAQKG